MMIVRDERGQGLVEYALIVALVALVAIAGVTLVGSKANTSVNASASRIP
ncbi:MAG: hypothetical protein NVS2B3_05250 [Vulcanimicrobiaceae bacterium]